MVRRNAEDLDEQGSDNDEPSENQAPVADAGADQEGTTYYDDSLERIVLDGSESFDTDGELIHLYLILDKF